MVRMSVLTFDQTFETAIAVSATLIVLSAAWIIRVLIQIEKSKAVALASVLEDDGTSGDLEFEESTAEAGAIEMSPTRTSGPKEDDAEAAGGAPSPPASPDAKPVIARKVRQRQRRITWMFLNVQLASVGVLVLLTYLLLVASNAPVFLRMLGSICVFGVFLRYQIGDEIRRQRVDRIMLLLSLFLLIASMLSTLVYSFKTLSQGEIYEGPARIVGYDLEQYNNTRHDPTTRTDIEVSWGKDWGCPMSGGKVCQAKIQGALCQTHPDKEQTKHKPHYDNTRRRRRKQRRLEDAQKEDNDKENDNDNKADDKDKAEENDNDQEEAEDNQKDDEDEEIEEALEEDLEDEEKSNQELQTENENLAEQNKELEKEIEELKEENEIEDEENQSLVDEENSEMDEMADEYNEDIMVVEEEMYEDAQDYEDAEYKEDEEALEDKIAAATDDDVKDDLNEKLVEEEKEQEEVDEEYEEDEELLDEYADEYEEAADEEYDEFLDEADETDNLEAEKDEKKEEAAETEAEINDMKSSSSSSSSSGADDDANEKMAEEFYEEEEEAIEEEYEEEEYEEEEEWYWDEYPEYYDDDSYEDDYWDYDWDSVWGDYACEDLFDSDVAGKTYDLNTPAGGDDEWPFVNIYGSCKTCEAYILDYFAEEAFEETQEFKQQAIVYLAGALAGFVWSLLSYIKYRVMPTAENEISLMGFDGGVMA